MRLYSVGEVRRFTGLNRKDLYTYEDLGIVLPADRMDNAVHGIVGNTQKGYKLYDQEGLNKLIIVALLKNLGRTPKQIKEVLDSPNYTDRNTMNAVIKDANKKIRDLRDIVTIAKALRVFDYSSIIGSFIPLLERTTYSELFEKTTNNPIHSFAEYIRKHGDDENNEYLFIQEYMNTDVTNLIGMLETFESIEEDEIDDLYKKANSLKDYIHKKGVGCPGKVLSALQLAPYTPDLRALFCQYIERDRLECICNNISNCLLGLWGTEVYELYNKASSNTDKDIVLDEFMKICNEWYGTSTIDDCIVIIHEVENGLIQNEMFNEEDKTVLGWILDVLQDKKGGLTKQREKIK